MDNTNIKLKTNTNPGNLIKLLPGSILVLILVVINVFAMKFGNMDEIWNYNLARSVANGLVSYRDFNMVMPPLFHFIFAIPVAINPTLFTYRIFTSLFLFIMCFLVMNITQKSTNNSCALLTGIITAFLFEIATYNHMFLLLAFIVYALNNKELTTKNSFAIGSCVMLSVFCRQSSGGILLIIESIYLLIKTYKTSIKNFWFYILGNFAVGLAFLIYFLTTNSFLKFWEYCLFALLGYGENSFNIDPMNFFEYIIIIVGLAIDISLIIKVKDKKAINHLIVGLSVISISIPLIDHLHASMAAAFFIVPIVECLNKTNLSKSFLSLIAVLIFITGSAIAIAPTINTESTDIPVFKNIPSSIYAEYYMELNDLNNKYRNSGYNVVVVSDDSSIFSILNDTFSYPYDLFLNGNMGTNEPISYIEDLCSTPNTIIVIPNDFNSGDNMNPPGVYDYINSKCQLIQTVDNYEYYLTQN